MQLPLRFLVVVFGLLVLLLSGCADKNVAYVTGSAKYEGIGVPAGTRVFFERPGTGYMAVAIVAEDGSYVLKHQGEEKLEPGDYQVFVGAPASNMSVAEYEALRVKVAKEFRKKGKKPPASPDWVLPEKYYAAATSPLRQAVAPGENQIDLVLED